MAPVRIGVVGCGHIAQVQHLPNLLELDEEFEVAAVCDISPKAAEYVGAALQGAPAPERYRRSHGRGYRRGTPLSLGPQDRGRPAGLRGRQARPHREAGVRLAAGSGRP